MKRFLPIAALVLGLCRVPCAVADEPAAPAPPPSVEAAEISTHNCNPSQWFLAYHREPHPERAVFCLKAFDEMGAFTKESAAPPLIGFFSALFADQPLVAKAVAEQAKDFSNSARMLLGYCLWSSGTEAGKEAFEVFAALESALGELRKTPPPTLAEILASTPEDLDFLWGGYFATGDEARLARIASALAYRDERGDTQKILLYAAARWSFLTNAQRDPTVKVYCRQQASAAEGVLREEFASLLDELDGKTPPRDIEEETMKKLREVEKFKKPGESGGKGPGSPAPATQP